MNRQESLATLRANPQVAVLVVGAGVNGISVFRELALQGVDVLLVDRGDFCGGASAGSSHMAHGGIRYLENGEFRLVREALKERNLLIQNAPHYVQPLPTTIPIFSWFSGLFNAPLKFLRLRDKPAERGALVIKVGMTMYDWFTRGQRSVPTHNLYLRGASLRKRPQLNPEIVCTGRYYDGFLSQPERICVEMVLDAEQDNPTARALNYLSVVDGAGDTVTLCDELTGTNYTVQPKLLINAAGPWVDFANRALGHQTQFIGGTKGAHLVLDHPELLAATRGEEIFFENHDGRIVLILPFFDRVMVGTTDIRVEDPNQARPTEEETDYILEMIGKVFPAIQVDRSHIVYKFTGVRPLPHSSTSRTGTISRDHSMREVSPDDQVRFPVFALVGGKWTTFRAFSEQVADQVLGRLNQARKVSTANMPIGGGRAYPTLQADQRAWLNQLEVETGIETGRLATLFERYGTRAADVARYMAAGPDAPLRSLPDYTRREIGFLA
ncbi:MAG: glycerol-3-phosphate dehydrogenase/oxidase, partial [Anaerolineae bacterium]|nr:glycerol-3-phosphate dehydrogenase/oxidase [Anaerolineae bacterium]